MQIDARSARHKDTDKLLSAATNNGPNVHHRRKYKWIAVAVISTTFIVIFFALLFAFDIIPWFDQSSSAKTTELGLFGKFPCYGGNARNQQIAPSQSDNELNSHNIHNLTTLCIYDSLAKVRPALRSAMPSSGYTTIDDDNRAYVTDASGFASCIDLDSCEPIWETNVAKVLGYNESVTKLFMRHTATLFTNSKRQKGIIFGAPNQRSLSRGYDPFDPCWAVALSVDDGSLLWSTKLAEGLESRGCNVHGFMVDENDHFAYGGMSNGLQRAVNVPFDSYFRGKMFKIDLDDGTVVHQWYSIDAEEFNYTESNVSDPYIYRAASMWNMPAIIDDYLVFGTGNLATYPKYIEECLLGNYSAFPMERANPIDPCGRNRSMDNKWWRCLEKGVYPDSFVILNKHTFEPLSITPLFGVDAWNRCATNPLYENDPNCMKVEGPDADLAAVAAYRDNETGKLYTAAMPKSGHFYVFEVPSGNAVISKKIVPYSDGGGGQWSMAVHEKRMIAIVSATGGNTTPMPYRYRLMDGTIVCGQTGSVHAIDLRTGKTIWQMVNPWGSINNCSVPIYDEYVDVTLNASCQFDMNGDPFIYPPLVDETVNVVIPEIDEDDRQFVQTDAQKFRSPVSIVEDMVFIPAWSGDIFVHSLLNGAFIYGFTSTGTSAQERYIMKGGVSVVEDRVIFQTGTNREAKLVSMKLLAKN